MNVAAALDPPLIIDEDHTDKTLQNLVRKKILINKRKAKDISCEIVAENQNKIENDMVLSDTEPDIDHEYKTPSKDTFSNVTHLQFNS